MDESISMLTERFKLLADKTRLSILALLRERDFCVCELVEILNMSQPGVSQHLQKLKKANLVTESRRAHWIYYHLNVEEIPELKLYMVEIPPLKQQINKIQTVCGE